MSRLTEFRSLYIKYITEAMSAIDLCYELAQNRKYINDVLKPKIREQMELCVRDVFGVSLDIVENRRFESQQLLLEISAVSLPKRTVKIPYVSLTYDRVPDKNDLDKLLLDFKSDLQNLKKRLKKRGFDPANN